MSTQALSLEEQRSRLERRANVVRSRLLRTIDALDNRRHQVQEIGHHAKRLAMPLAVALAGATVLAIGGVIGIRALITRRRERSFAYRFNQALAPYRTEHRLPLWKETLRKVTLTAVTILAAELSKRVARSVVDGRALPAPRTTPPLLAR